VDHASLDRFVRQQSLAGELHAYRPEKRRHSAPAAHGRS
jgi:hypothetical protein